MPLRRLAGGRRIYVDLGANEGETVGDFLDGNRGWTAYAFEPAPHLAARLRKRFAGKPVVVIEAAASTTDGQATFYPGIDSDQSSTLLTGKRQTRNWRVDYSAGYNVRTVDFVRWLKDNTSPLDEIIVKMDIEGAEYLILPAMTKAGVLSRLKELRVEWHWNRYPKTVTKAEHDDLHADISRRVHLVRWS